jgi:hypothetical protein
MSAKVTFLSEPAPVESAGAPRRQVTAPQVAVVTREGGPRVYEVVDGAVKVRPVQTGVTRGETVVITSGLSGGETLVANPPADLADGARVRVKQ